MPQQKIDAAKSRAGSPKASPAAKKPEKAPKYAGTDIEAFYAAQLESAADSRDYAAGRRKR